MYPGRRLAITTTIHRRSELFQSRHGESVSKRTVNIVLIVWLCVTWSAVIFKVDGFPLTYAPMYATWEPQDVLKHPVVEKATYVRGLPVTRRNGTTDFIGLEDVNLPRKHMYSLYYHKIQLRNAFLHLRSLNKTLKLEPDDPEFIVRITVPVEYMYRRLSDVSNVWRNIVVTDLEWNEDWREGW